MDSTRIKIKIGEHEFEAEGPASVVQSQFDDFKRLVANTPQHVAPSAKNLGEQSKTHKVSGGGEIPLDKICRVEGRVVSLTVKPESESVAATLIMLGQRTYRNNEAVTASEIKSGLEQSGYRIDRIDRIMQPLTEDGSAIRIGFKKGTRYRFTNQGMANAQIAAKSAIAQVS